jgi:hypothetical protein
VDPDLLGPSRSVRKQVENVLSPSVGTDSPTAVLGQVEAAEALSVYVQVNRHPRHEIALGRKGRPRKPTLQRCMIISLWRSLYSPICTTTSGSRRPWTACAVRTLQWCPSLGFALCCSIRRQPS